MPRSEVVLEAGGAGGITSRLLGALAKRMQERRAKEEEQQRAIELLFKEAEAKQAFPSAEERINRLRLGLAGLALGREPTQAEATAAIPPSATQRLRRGEVAVPGPEGGVVMGRGEVSPGSPQGFDLLRSRLGEPLARTRIAGEAERAKKALELLNTLGIGQRLPTSTGLEGVVIRTGKLNGRDVLVLGNGDVVDVETNQVVDRVNPNELQ